MWDTWQCLCHPPKPATNLWVRNFYLLSCNSVHSACWTFSREKARMDAAKICWHLFPRPSARSVGQWGSGLRRTVGVVQILLPVAARLLQLQYTGCNSGCIAAPLFLLRGLAAPSREIWGRQTDTTVIPPTCAGLAMVNKCQKGKLNDQRKPFQPYSYGSSN